MILRDYQALARDAAVAALEQHGNTLVTAPTGAGKSVLIAAIAEAVAPTARVMVLQHTETLIHQNAAEYRAFSGKADTGIVQGPLRDWGARVIFGTIQTVQNYLGDIPSDVALVVVDEGHRIAAPGYIKTLRHLRELNPALKVLAVTATPERSDKKSLMSAGITNMCFTIEEVDLIRRGVLVRPRFLVQDVGITDEMAALADSSPFGEQPEVAALMNREVVVDAVVNAWQEHAGGRKSVFFAPDVESCERYADAFSHTTNAVAVHSKLSRSELKKRMAQYASGEAQIILNPMMLIEGWNDPPTSCVGLLRNASHRSPLKQMIGRGLRRLDTLKYPGLPAKTDCLVLDFGVSLAKHDNLFDPVSLLPPNSRKGPAVTKDCKECGFLVPASCRECPNCGHVFAVRVRVKDKILEVTLVEKELLQMSPFRWITNEAGTMLVNAMNAWAALIERRGQWHAFVGMEKGHPRCLHLTSGPKELAIAAADDWLRAHGNVDAAAKSKRWMKERPTDKQLSAARQSGIRIPITRQITRYEMSCLLSLEFNRKQISPRLSMLS